jgi:hypothetical protein
VANPFTPAVPELADLLRQAHACYCQPEDGFVAIPDAGTYLVHEGRAVTVPEPVELPSLNDLIGQTLRRVFEEAARALVGAPDHARAEVRLTAEGVNGLVDVGTFVIARPPEAGENRG